MSTPNDYDRLGLVRCGHHLIYAGFGCKEAFGFRWPRWLLNAYCAAYNHVACWRYGHAEFIDRGYEPPRLCCMHCCKEWPDRKVDQ